MSTKMSTKLEQNLDFLQMSTDVYRCLQEDIGSRNFTNR